MSTADAFVDAHCHIDLFESPRQVLEEAERQHVYTIAVTNAPSVFEHSERLAESSTYVRTALGLHPELVCTHGGELALFRSLLGRTRYVGEVGLDYFTSDAKDRETQRKVFASILEWCAEDGGKTITVHSRRAATDVVAAVGESFPGSVILHWFTGTPSELEAASRCGLYFSVNPAMAGSPRGRSLIAKMAPDRVITETDGPFVQIRNRVARPVDVRQVLTILASIWQVDEDEARLNVLANFRRLLRKRNESDTVLI